MHKLKQIFAWFDIHGLFVLTAFLIAFIPLFPKIPIFDVLPGYIVRARPEDVLILITAMVWIKDALKHRFKFKTTYFWIVLTYTISGMISILLGALLIQSIPTQLLHIGKSGLHLFRYLEYFALFFFTYSSIKTQKQLKVILIVLTFTILGAVLYGFGQEYWHFPLYSTMNREYSKGTTLYLQQGARAQSTFAGHYDLAAYLVIVLPIIFSLALSTLKINRKNAIAILAQKSTYLSLFLHIVHIFGAWMLVTSGSKTALLAYVIGISIVLLYYLRKLANIKQQLKWGSIAVVILTIALTIFLNFFAQTTKNKFISLVKTTFQTNVPSDSQTTPDDLVGSGVVFKQITIVNDDGTQRKEWIEERSTWSKNALKYGLSMGIRLDTLWPNALKGFVNNPLFGNGYSTLVSISNPGEYSTAESTDNNFLRTLGETGILGFLIFYGFIGIISWEIYKQKSDLSPTTQALRIGFLASTVGLLINATYIDVFAASKVAYTFWAFAGVTIAALKPHPSSTIRKLFKHTVNHWSLYLAVLLTFFFLHKNPFHQFALIKDLNISDSQIESLTAAKCFIDTGSFTTCSNNGLVLKQNINIYSILLVPFLTLYDNPMMFYFLNLTLIFTVLCLIYKLLAICIRTYTMATPKQLLFFASLFIFILAVTTLEYSSKPLSTYELFMLFFLIPTLLIIYSIFIHTITYRLAFFAQICAILVAILFLINRDYGSVFLNQFRNNQISDKYTVLNLQNVHFDTHRYLNRESDFYIISAMNPYYVDLFSNNNYALLPLSESQAYFKQAEKVYKAINSQEPLIEQFTEIIKHNSVYATDYGTKTNETYLQAFQNLKNTFDLTYEAIGCDDSCSLFSISQAKPKISPSPISVNSQKLVLSNLKKPYSFTLISNRYEPKTPHDSSAEAYSAKTFASFLNTALTQQSKFLVITGDIIHDNNEKTNSTFNTLFNRLPIVYSVGNTDLTSSKYHQSQDSYFFTESEFFIFLDTNMDSQITQSQQLFLYNALLQIEKLPNIKSIFIISHNLNWQVRSNPNNFIFELEKKLSQFPNITKYIISSHHTENNNPQVQRSEVTAKHIIDENTKTQYLSSFVRDWENDSFFEFSIAADGTVNILYRVRGENF